MWYLGSLGTNDQSIDQSIIDQSRVYEVFNVESGDDGDDKMKLVHHPFGKTGNPTFTASASASVSFHFLPRRMQESRDEEVRF